MQVAVTRGEHGEYAVSLLGGVHGEIPKHICNKETFLTFLTFCFLKLICVFSVMHHEFCKHCNVSQGIHILLENRFCDLISYSAEFLFNKLLTFSPWRGFVW